MVKIGEELLTLEHFLKLPEFKPALEFFGGRVVQKMSPMLPHSIIQTELASKLNGFARPTKLGRAYTELRWTFGGQSQVPDVSFFVPDRTPKFVRGERARAVLYPPDIVVEILSQGQTLAELRAKIRHALRHGSQLGWLIHPIREVAYVLRPARAAEPKQSGDLLPGEHALPGFDLAIDEIFGWLDGS